MAQSVRPFNGPLRTVSYDENNSSREELPRGPLYRELYLRLQGQSTLTTLENIYANVLKGDEWGVVKKIEIVANGTDTIRSISGNALWWLNYFLYANAPRVTPVLGDGSANPAFDSVLIIPFWMPGTIKPIQTALDSSELSSLEIVVHWGDAADICSKAATGDDFESNPSIEVYACQSVGLAGPFSGWNIWTIQKDISATSARFEVDLPVNNAYRGFLLELDDDGADDGGILNNLKLVSGTATFVDVSCGDDVLQQVQHIRGGAYRGYSGTAYQDLRQGNNNDVDGWYFLDLVTDGFLTEALDTQGFSEIKLELDVTYSGSGTETLRVYPLEVVPVRG